jgi:hypothetical protein
MQLAATVAMGCFVYMPNLCLKEGVHVNGAHFDAVMVRIIDVARETAPPMEKGTVWITSANDSIHREGSLHFDNRAFDIRIKNIVGAAEFPLAAYGWAHRMSIALGDDYDVILGVDHIHVEYDPKVTP